MNKNPEVDAYLTQKAHPMNAEIQLVREIILSTHPGHPGIKETIKWNSPTFIYKGNMASYFMNAKKHVSLMFHKGAAMPDNSGLLQGDGKEARVAKFGTIEEVQSRKKDLENVVLGWIRLQGDK